MGLRLNHLSASNFVKDGAGRNALAASGSIYFQPNVHGLKGASTDTVMGFAGHTDAAYIFSGTVGGNDKSVFLGDVVVSGSLALGSGGSFLEGSMTANRVPFAQDADTLIDDADLVFVAAGMSGSDSGGQGRLDLGDSQGDNVAISLAADDIVFYADDESGEKHAGLVTHPTAKLAITGSKTTGVSTEVGGVAGVILGQNGATAGGFINVRSLTGTGDADSGVAAIKVQSDAGGVLLQSAQDKKLILQNANADLSIKLIDDNSDPDNEKITIINSNGTDDGAIRVRTAAGGFDLDASKNVTLDSSAGSIKVGFSLADGQSVDLGKPGATEIQLAPHGTPASEKITVTNTSGSSDDAIKLRSHAGGITLAADGTSASALDIDSGGGIDVDARSSINIATVGSTGDITLASAHGAGQALYLSGAANAGSIVDIDAGILDIDAVGAASITSAGGDIALRPLAGRVLLTGSSGADSVLVQSEATFSSDVVVAGNLTVNGTQVAIDGETVVMDDSLMELATVNKAAPGSTTATKDKGILLHHHDGSSASLNFMGFDSTNEGGKFTFKTGVTDDGDGSISGGSVATVKANLEGSSSLSLVTDSTANTAFPVVFHDENNALLDSQFIEINPSEKALIFTGGDAADTAIISVDANGALEIQASDDGGANADIILDADGDVVFRQNGGSTDFAKLTVGLNGATTLATVDAVGTVGHFTLDADGDIILDADGGAVDFKDDGVEKIAFTLSTTNPIIQPGGSLDLEFGYMNGGSDVEVFRLDQDGGGSSDGSLLMSSAHPIEFGASTKSIVDVGTALRVVTNGDLLLSASADVRIPKNVGLVFSTDNAEKIESDDTDLTIQSGGKINLTAGTDSDVHIPANVGVVFGNGEKIEGNDTDLTITSGQHVIVSANSVRPDADNDVDLGASNLRFANIYTGDLNLRNDRGDWTLIEESDFISFRNNKTGRRFRMVMEDITGTGTYGPGNDGEM